FLSSSLVPPLDFMFRQLKKTRVFDPPKDVVRERSNLLAISNKFGLVFAGGSPGLKIFHTKDLLVPIYAGEDPNHVVAGPAGISMQLKFPTHHVALSSDNLTLSVCIAAGEHGTIISFYDVRTLLNEAKPQKRPFASYKLTKNGNSFVADLKWNPAIPAMVAVCLDDGSISVLQVTDTISVYAALPASMGVTSVCWSPKGKQLAVGKQNGTIVQFLPNLQEKKVIPCPSFYNSENPVKVLDVLWVSTYVFSVVYAAADGSEIPPQLVMVYLPKKEDKRAERFQTFPDVFYGSCTERQQHFFLNYMDGWEILLGASAVSIEVCVVARPPEDDTQVIWVPEDSGRAELPVNENSDDTLPMGLVVDYTSQLDVAISEENVLPPAPVLLILSTDGVLCPFHLINLNPGVKSLTIPPERLSLEGERQLKATGMCLIAFALGPLKSGGGDITFFWWYRPFKGSVQSVFCMVFTVFFVLHGLYLFSGAGSTPAAAAIPPATAAQPPAQPSFSAALTNLAAGAAPGALPFSFTPKSAPANSMQATPPAFSFQSMQAAGGFGIGGLGPNVSAPPAQAPLTTSSFLPASSTVKVNLKNKYVPTSALRWNDNLFLSRQLQASLPLESHFKQSNESDPFLTGIKEEITQFQKELDDLKARTTKSRVLVGTEPELRQLRTETDDLQDFLLKIKETAESLNSEVCVLKMNLLEQFAGVQEAREQNQQKQDPRFRNLLYKKPLDPKSEAQMQEIRRLQQYVNVAVQDVNDVLDMEWDQHLMIKKKQKRLVVPESERLFNTLANNQEIISQQKQQLNQLVDSLQQLRLYNQESEWSVSRAPQRYGSNADVSSSAFHRRSEVIRTNLFLSCVAVWKPTKLSALKQRQLREFLANRKMPVIRALAPASLHRSSFLAPSFFEDLDDISSTSSLSETAGIEDRRPLPHEVERQETPPPEVTPIRAPQHAAVVRTSSVLPGFGPPSAAFVKQPFGTGPITSTPAVPAQSIRVIPQGADSTMLATKTVKHGAPPVPPQQAAAAAALRRQIANQGPTTLSETTLQTVPQVVNVKDLKGNGPGPTISTALGPSVPHSAAQVIHQVLASAGSVPAKQSSPPRNVGLFYAASDLVSALHSLASQQLVRSAYDVIAAHGFQSIVTNCSMFLLTGSAAASRDPGQTSSFPFVGGKPVFGSGATGPFSFKPAPQPSSSPLADASASSTPVKPPVSSTASLTVSSTTADKSLEVTAAKQGDGIFQISPAGETLGSFSGLRVGPIEETTKPENPKATLPTQPTKLPNPTPLFGPPAGLQASNPGEVSSTTSSSSSSLYTNLQLSGTGPSPSSPSLFAGASNPALSFLTPSKTLGATSVSAASQSVGPSALDIKQPVKPDIPALPSLPQQSHTAGANEGDKDQTPKQAVTGTSTVATAASFAPAAASMGTTSELAAVTKPEAAPVPSVPATVTSGQTAPIIPEAASPPAPVSTLTGDLSSQTPAAPSSASAVPPAGSATAAPPTGGAPPAPPSGSSTTFGAQAAPSSTQPATSAFGQPTPSSPAPSLFGQQGANPASTSAGATPGFGASAFGQASTAGGGFGSPSFGQAPAFWKPQQSATAASNFSFAPSSFGAQPAFGQPSASTAAAPSSGNLFGSTAGSGSAASFSFLAQSNGGSAPAAGGGGLFGQSNTPAFGQSSGFGQATPVFGNASSTTTTSSMSFGFQQSSGKSLVVFPLLSCTVWPTQGIESWEILQMKTACHSNMRLSVVLRSRSICYAAGISRRWSHRFFITDASTLFGNSGAKAFGFGNVAFGDQKSPGTFSGGGSVASQGFGFPSPSKTGGFGAAPVFGSPPTFGGSPGFGGSPAFSTAPAFANPLGPTGGKVFGEGTAASSTGGFGFGTSSSNVTFSNIANQNTPTFGSLTQQNTGFLDQQQQQQSTGFSGFGSSGSGAPAGSSGGTGSTWFIRL
uniref:Nuclear pore complex protein Nup214 n=1 Tax=Leptobrachium leishanense TaxID=445787 RepID=A0A8C5QLA6_9ANUR